MKKIKSRVKLKNRRSTSDPNILRAHFIHQLRDRYGISLTLEEYRQVCDEIERGDHRRLSVKSAGRRHYMVEIKGKLVRTVWDTLAKCLVTALPM